MTLIFLISSGKEFFQYDAETDYLGIFVPEAMQALNGDPLELRFHPPLYPLVLALVQFFVGDWLVAGLTISFLSAFVVLTCAFVFFSDICGRYAAWGAVVGLVGSVIFVRFSATASSDLFFLALYFVCSVLAAKAILTRSATLWFLTGMIVACGLLARSNGLGLVFLLLVPWFCRESLKQRGIHFGCVIAGFLTPISAWLVYATVTGSPFTPSGNVINLAMTYFSPTGSRADGDTIDAVRLQFGHMSVIDVLLYDPAHLIKTYLLDLGRLITWRLPELVQFPLDLFFLPGLAFLILKSLNRYFALFLLLAAGQVLLVNFKAFEPRYGMFLLPFMGAGAGELFRQIVAAASGRVLKTIAAALLLLGAAAAGGTALVKGNAAVHAQDAELAEVLPIVEKEVRGDAVIVSRKPNLSHHVSVPGAIIPQVDTEQALNCFLWEQTEIGTVYLYYGSFEQAKRPQFRALLLSDTPPPWLVKVAESAVRDRWVLYRYRPVGDGRGGPC